MHLKTDSPQLYLFTKKVIELYRLNLVEDSDNVYAQPDVIETLKIKTHYESLDIAQSKKIHYLKFTLPSTLPVLDEQLKEMISHDE